MCEKYAMVRQVQRESADVQTKHPVRPVTAVTDVDQDSSFAFSLRPPAIFGRGIDAVSDA